MKLAAIMERNPTTVAPGDTLRHARDLMVWGHFRHLPVVVDGKVVGVLSERDVTAHQARTGESLASSPGDTVSMAMSSRVQTASPDDSVADAARRMANSKVGCLPVLSAGALVGIVTNTDILAAQSRETHEREECATLDDCMPKAPQAVHSNARLLDAAALMSRLGVRHLPVVDAERRVVGMLSDRDMRSALGGPEVRPGANTKQTVAENLRVQDV